MGPQWKQLAEQANGKIQLHTLLVLWTATKLDLLRQMSPEDQNIIAWALLMHDLRKLGEPVIQGKDHIHPFKSAIAVLEVFKLLGILDVGSETKNKSYN